MTHPHLRTERLLAAACLALLLLALLGPAFTQPAGHHHFADQRIAWGIPCAADVLSNLPFALFGLLGLVRLSLAAALQPMQRACAVLFFAGLVATAAGSAWYHWQPDDTGLAVDRLGMSVAFAGLLALAAADRVSARAGAVLAGAVLWLGPASVLAWSATGNVLPWCVLQFGGMALMLWLAVQRPMAGASGFSLVAVIAVYALAKALELADHAVWDLTGQLVSGHTLKHLVASLAALPVLVVLGRRARPGQNAAAPRARTT